MEKFRLYFTQTPRLVWVCDEQSGQYLILATNEMSWTADTISQLYKARWAIDSFFKHLKQLFRVKTFVGGYKVTDHITVQKEQRCSIPSSQTANLTA